TPALPRPPGRDHWYAETGDAYYRQAARNFLTDAEALVPPPADGRKPVLPGRAEVDQLINAPALTLSAPELIDWTSEPSRTLEYGVTAAPVLKGDGYVALWPQVPPGVVTARPEDTRREA